MRTGNTGGNPSSARLGLVELLLEQQSSPHRKGGRTGCDLEGIRSYMVGLGRRVSAVLLALAKRVSSYHPRWAQDLVQRREAKMASTTTGGEGQEDPKEGHREDITGPKEEVYLPRFCTVTY